MEEVIAQLLEWLRDAVNFAQGELPEVAREFVAWEYYSALFTAIAYGVTTVVSLAIAIIAWGRRNKQEHWCDRRKCVGTAGVFLQISAVLFFASMYNVHRMIKVSVAPKVYLIENLRSK